MAHPPTILSNRVFQLLEPAILIDILKNDGFEFIDSLVGTHINIDGKKVKGYSPKSKGNTGIYIVNAWLNEHKLCIGQTKVAQIRHYFKKRVSLKF